jgi:steroid 5-alpha reductase family enzyme
MQGLWVVLTSAAAIAILSFPRAEAPGLLFGLGAAMWLAGFVIETVADAQKTAFRRDPANAGRFIDVGLWSWSQHPNYFGEILLWAGIAVMAVPVLEGPAWLVLISPLFVYVLLTRISGTPLLDKAAKARWGDDPAYQAYRKRTSKLIPLPPR